MNKKLVAVVSAAAIFVTSCTSFQGVRQVASEPDVEAIAAQGRDYQFSGDQRARPFGGPEIRKLSAAPDLKLIDGQLLKDNDAAFDKKVEMINRAQSEIRMVYFIYASDDSSSVINQALIAKAQQGVKVKLLVDFITNYKNLDLFQMLEARGSGNIKTYFYNFPGGQIVQDANYMTLPCPETADPKSDTCYKDKMSKMNAMGDKKVATSFSKIFLSGLYGKNSTAIKVAMGYGAEIDPAKYKQSSAGKTAQQLEEEKENLIDFVELVTDAFIKNSIWAKIKLSMAMVAYGDTLNPLVNEATGRLPFRSIEKNEDHGQLWDHLSDYVHHKLLAIDGEEFLLGGRNIEDSYHMQERVGSSGKYIFIDTDFWGKTAQGGTAKVEASYDTILKTNMVADMVRVQRVMPNDFIANTKRASAEVPSASEMAVGACLQSQAADLGGCILTSLPKMPGYKSGADRMAAEEAAMAQSVARYQSKYVNAGKKQNNKSFGQLSANDLQNAEFHYIENVNYRKGNLNQRIMGSKLGAEAKNNKNIHAAWYGALEHTCRVSRKQERNMEVIIHSAYLFMPSGMVHRIAKMMNNDYGDCSRVKLVFITNSPETTDLGPINLLARYQLGALFDHYQGLVQYEKKSNDSWLGRKFYKRFFPTLEYYEYKAVGGTGQSLHSKVSLIGDDLIIGSANADVRSYYMDTNNAIFIRNANDLNQQYRDYVKGLISSGRIENRMASFVGKSAEELRGENAYMLDMSAKRWKQEARLTPQRKDAILNTLDKAGAKITNTTKRLLTFRGEFDFNNFHNDNNNQYYINKELNDIANDFDGTFKVF